MKEKIFAGKGKVKDIQRDSIIKKGEEFTLDPAMIEHEKCLGNSSMRKLIKEFGLKYMRVKSNGESYIFTNSLFK